MFATQRVTEGLETLKAAFLDAPQRRISPKAAAQIAGLDIDTCKVLLEALRDVGFLRSDPRGLFARRTYSDPHLN